MKLLFTTSEKPMARLIRWATGEDCSHVAIQWEGFIVHSNMYGVNSCSVEEFLSENTVVHELEIPEDREKLLKVIANPQNSPYDIGALLFCGFMLFCRKALNLKSWPKQNLWQSSGMYMCTEFVTEFVEGKADSMVTPCKLYHRIKQ